MGRTRTPLPTVTQAQHAEVERRLRRRDLTARERERLEMVKAVAVGYNLEQIATWTGRSTRRIHCWLGQFAQHGVAALADKAQTGRPVKADSAYRRPWKRPSRPRHPTSSCPSLCGPPRGSVPIWPSEPGYALRPVGFVRS